MDVVLTGTIDTIKPIEEKNNYKSQKVFVTIEADSKYPQTIVVEFGDKKLDEAAKLQQGQQATFHCNLRGRKWQDTCFNTLSVWKVEAGVAPQPHYIGTLPQTDTAHPAYVAPEGGGETKDDLPF